MRRPHGSKTREDFIEKTMKQFQKRINSMQLAFFRAIYEYLDQNIDIRDGAILSVSKNYRAIEGVGIVAEAFQRKQGSSFIKWIARKYVQTALLNRRYFQKIDSKSNRIGDTVRNSVLSQFGITVKDKKISISKKSVLQDLVRFDVSTVKSIALSQAADGQSLTQLKTAIRRYSRSTDKNLPVKKLDRVASESFRQFDRAMGQGYGKRLGLRAVVWQGGQRATSRDLCIRLNNTVVTYEELEALKDEEWEGKWPEGSAYNPFIHVGGINCYHYLDHISDALALRIRPELKDIWGL